MFRLIMMILFVSIGLTACTVAEEPTVLSTSPTPLPDPTATVLPPTPTAVSSPTMEPTAVSPTATTLPTATAVLPTPEPAPEGVTIDGDCFDLERPLTYTAVGEQHEFLSLTTNKRCTLQFSPGQQFAFHGAYSDNAIFGTLFANEQLQLIRIGKEGTVEPFGVKVSGFFSHRMLVSPDGSQVVWADGDGDPNDPEQFVSQLWIANSDGSEPSVIYEHKTNLSEALLLEILIPIGFRPSGEVLFRIEPSGRGGGWIDHGEYSNLVQTAVISVEKQEEEQIFSCPPETPFCIGDFSDDFTRFAYADSLLHSLTIVEIASGNTLWQTTISDRTFVGQPQFNLDGDLAFIAVDVVDDGNALHPENGYIGVIDAPYDGDETQLSAELATVVVTWIDDEKLLYYELSSNSSGEWRYPVLTRDGEEVGVWQSDGRFPQVIR